MDLVHQLEAPDFPVALGWVESTIHQGWHHLVEEAINQILLETWWRLESPEVLKPFTRIALKRLIAFDRIVSGREEETFSNDLLINLDRRKSDILLRYSVHACIYVTSICWPDLGREDIKEGIENYNQFLPLFVI